MDKDIYGAWSNNKWSFTLEMVCKIIGAEIPLELMEHKDNLLAKFAFRSGKALTGGDSILFDTTNRQKDIPSKVKYLKDGVFLITSNDYYDEDNHLLPVIKVEDANESWIKIGQYMKKSIVMPTIGITGSVGKTTTTLMAECVFNEKYKVFLSGENGQNVNAPKGAVSQMIKRYGPEYNFHIQECGGGRPKLVEELARIIDADVFGVTKIDRFHHIDNYKTVQCIIEDKTCFDQLAKEGAVGVINLDDEILSDFPFKSKMISYGIENTTADYVAINIEQNGPFLEFDVDDHEKLVHIKIEIPGNHNVYNALMVFAFAKIYHFTDEEIQRGFMKYSSGTIRQALREVSGRNLYVDCFNVCSASIKSSCATLQNFSVQPGNRRIAVIGGENALGENSQAVNVETGKSLGGYAIDEFIFVGPKEPATAAALNFLGNGKAVYEGAKTVIDEKKIVFFDDLQQLANKLRMETKPGDAILFKGVYRLPLFAAIDMAFGTCYTVHNPNLKREKVRENGFSGEYFEFIHGVNIEKRKGAKSIVELPDTISEKPVVRLHENLFAEHDTMSKISFGQYLQTIGERCFFKCEKLVKIDLPENVIHIEKEGFSQCKNLTHVSLTGIQQIEEGGFKGCVNLKQVVLTRTCVTIEPEAFADCPKVTFIAPKDSYAYAYAVEHKIKVVSKAFAFLSSILG